ncbi:MAG: hypothetical protein VX641_04365 [Planctomycetota bacterium]|nr:hypothetical protein [Planctomycetota bacterium]
MTPPDPVARRQPPPMMNRSRLLHPILRLTVLLSLGLVCGAQSGCSDPDEDVYEAPEVMLRQRPFTAPGQISQGLGPKGRALIFIVRESLPGRPAVEFDESWTFEIAVTGPTGDAVPTDPDPVVPRSWSTDSGVKLVGGFNADREGNHLVTVTSPNCPPRTASMIILPIN